MNSVHSIIERGAERVFQEASLLPPLFFDDLVVALCILCVLCGLVGVVVAIFVPWLKRRDARAKQRLDLLAASIERPEIDAQVRSQVLRTLAMEHESVGPLHRLMSSSFWVNLTFGLGWLLFVGALGCALLLLLSDDSDAYNALFFAVGGLAILSLPIALRELGLRKASPSATSGRADSSH